MDEADRKTLQRNRTKIVKDLHNIDEVNSKLFEKEVFNEGMREEVEVHVYKAQIKYNLLCLFTADPKVFIQFLLCKYFKQIFDLVTFFINTILRHSLL